MLNIEVELTSVLLLLGPTPAVADVGSELARCQLEAQRLFPPPPNKGAQNWADRAANLQKRAENVETCMPAAGFRITAECSAPLQTYESCMQIADQIMHSPAANHTVMLIGIESVWIMNGTCGLKNGCQQIAIGPAVGGAASWGRFARRRT